MDEITFHVDEGPKGRYRARALHHAIFTEADGLEHLYVQVRDAVRCHFDEGQLPRRIRLLILRQEEIPL